MRRVLVSLLAGACVVTYTQRNISGVEAQSDLRGDRPRRVAGTMQETLLATLPADAPLKVSQLPYALMFSEDGRRVAYFVRYRDGDLMNEAVVHGGGRGPAVTFISQGTLSPDGSRIAYLASFRDNVRAAYLIIGNRRDQVQITVGRTDPKWVPVFSPDGNRLAYKAETASGKRVIKVADVSDVSPESHTDSSYTQLSAVSGPEFDDVDEPRFNADGSHFAYAARDRGNWTIVVDGKPGPIYKDADAPVLHPSGRTIAFRATRDNKRYFNVIGDQETPSFDMVTPPAFSPDGSTFAYGAQERRTWWVVVGTERRRAAHAAEHVVFSADGKRLAYWAIERRGGKKQEFVINGKTVAIESGGKERVLVDGKAGPEFDKVGWPVFDDSATVAAYWARDKDKYVMVVGERTSDRFDGVGRSRLFSADGSELGFGVLQGNEIRWKVMKTR